MTEFEIAYLANEYQMTVSVYGSTAFTTVTAFLVAGYLAAHRLPPFMLGTVILVYTVWLAAMVGYILRTMSNLGGLATKAQQIVKAGGGLEWHNVAAYHGEWVAPTQASLVILMAIIYVASLVFFFHCRRVNRKAELEATARAATSAG